MDRSCTVSGSIGGALLVALLLTGCSGEDDGAEASPSSTASSTASAGATAEDPASPAPSTEETPAEYVPASLERPAQNVPKPVMPELAKEESRAGAQAFLDYWSDAMWYAYQTGDTSYAREIISPNCDVCIDQLDLLDEIYEEGSWAIGGREEVLIQDKDINRAADGVYKPVVLGSTEGAKLVENGVVTLDVPPSDGADDPHLIYMDFVDNEWLYISAANLPGVSHENS